jgi:hypothetical protein
MGRATTHFREKIFLDFVHGFAAELTERREHLHDTSTQRTRRGKAFRAGCADTMGTRLKKDKRAVVRPFAYGALRRTGARRHGLLSE